MNIHSVTRGRRGTTLVAVVSATAVAVSMAVAAILAASSTAPAAAEESPATDGVAQTEEEARAEAESSGESVEVLAYRAERRDVVANPDGTMTVRHHTAPVRTLKDGEWVAPESTLEPLEGGGFAPAAATVDLAFSGGGDGPLVEVDANQRGISLGWAGSLPEPTVEGSTATYPEVLPGVDLVVTALVDGFSHLVVVKDREAAANPELRSIEFPVTSYGADVRGTKDGGVEVIDPADGSPIMVADAPTMWDSTVAPTRSGEERSGAAPDAAPDGVPATPRPEPTSGASEARGAHQAPVDVSVDDDSVDLVPDQEMLTDPDTTYPVYIDPVYRDEYRSAWSMVDSGYPNERYWKFDGADDEGLGRCPVSSGWCNNSQVKRLFYRVSTSFYDGKEILDAQFVAVLKDNWSHANTPDHARLYLMNSGISSSTRWSNQPSGSQIATANTPEPSYDCQGLNDGGTEWDVTPEVQDAADDGTNTLTFGLRNASESDSTKWMRFCHNAYLQVRYNTPPTLPDTDDLSMSPGAGCSWSLTGNSYVNRVPTLEAYLFDADHGKLNQWGPGGSVSEQLRAQFRLLWGDGSQWTSSLTSAKASGSRFTVNLDTVPGLPTLPHDEPIGWIVRAYDGSHYSPWSWSGSQTRCRFVIDPTAPDPPTITSDDFPDDGSWSELVGEYGEFEFSSTSSDVVRYRYDFTNDSIGPRNVDAAGDGTATVSFMPARSGPHVLTVEAFDQAENSSVESYSFAVSTRTATGEWPLADPVGSGQAEDTSGEHPATAGSGVTFGASGPGANTAAELDGTVDAYLQTEARSLADTGEGFGAAAWVQVADTSRDQIAVSVNGLGEPGFTLGYDSAAQAWSFSIPDYDLHAFRDWSVTSGQASVEVGEWAHLAAVFTPDDAEMRLYVNGSLAASGERGSHWHGDGRVQIGRGYESGHYGGNWDGRLAEVRIFDRVLFEDEIVALSRLAPLREAYWQLNEAPDGESPEYDGGQPLTLSGGTSIYHQVDPDFDRSALVGEGHLELDGVDGHAATSAAVIDTSDSFSVTARVRLTTEQPSSDMTVFSLSGANTSLVQLRYSAALDRWELLLAESDTNGASTVSVTSPVDPSAAARGQFVAVVYNAFTDQVTLYVAGVPSVPLAEPFDDPWTAAGGLQVGRSLSDGAFGDYLSGAVDDVRCYAGILDDVTVQRLSFLYEQPDL